MSLRTSALIVSLALGACTGMASDTGSPGLDGTSWVLASLGGKAPRAGTVVTAQFADGRVAGSDGCNRYSAPYESAGSGFSLGARGASTMMACPPDVMAQAEAFLEALNRASARRLADGQLQLLGDDGTVLASFVPQPATLAGTAWRVSAYNNGRQAVTSVVAGTSLTLAFDSDGRVSGSAGCNNYTGPYALAGEQLTIGPLAATRRMCVEPPGVMDQEQQFLEALSTVATARFEGGRVELRTATGALAATLVKQ